MDQARKYVRRHKYEYVIGIEPAENNNESAPMITQFRQYVAHHNSKSNRI